MIDLEPSFVTATGDTECPPSGEYSPTVNPLFCWRPVTNDDTSAEGAMARYGLAAEATEGATCVAHQ